MGCTFVTPSPDHLSLTVTCSMRGVAREEENGGRVVTQKSSRGPLEQGLGCARGDAAAAAVTSQEPPRERGGVGGHVGRGHHFLSVLDYILLCRRFLG